MSVSTQYPLATASASLPRWYKMDKGKDLGSVVLATIQFLDQRQRFVSDDNFHNLRLYCNYEAMNMAGDRVARTRPSGSERAKLTLNLARAMVDTAQARMIQNKPKPTFLTSGGDISAQQVAKRLDKLTEGMFYHTKIYQVGQRVCKDAMIFGTGAAKIIADSDGKPRADRIFIDELLADEQEAMRGNPRQMFHRWPVEKEEMAALHPKFAKQIMLSSLPEYLNRHRADQLANQGLLMEAWHLPSTPGAKDGRRWFGFNNVTLADEPWEFPYFPFVFLRWNERPVGFWGQGIPEQVQGLQYEVNQLLRKAQQQMRLAGPKVFLERGSSIVSANIDNEVWGIINYTGTEPKYVVFDAVEPTLLQQIENLYQKGFQDVGISQMAAQQQKPAGLNSGKALLTFDNIEDMRFLPFGLRYEQWYMECAEHMLDIARATHMQPGNDDEEDEPRPFVMNVPVKKRGRRFLEQVSWSDIDKGRDEYLIQVFPTSMLPREPAGRLQAVGDMIDKGMLQGDEAAALLDFPDLDRVTSLMTAAIDDVDMLLEQMLEEGVPCVPEPFTNLDLAISRMTSALLRAKVDGAPDERLELVRRYLKLADDARQKAAAAAQQQQQGPMAAPAVPQQAMPPPPVAGAPGAPEPVAAAAG